MTSKPDGGAAFPIVLPGYDVVDGEIADHGMSLRDWFAGMALHSLGTITTDQASVSREEHLIPLAQMAYKLADEMIAARNKEP